MKKSHLIGRKLAGFAVAGAAVVAGIATLSAQAADNMKELRFAVEASYAPFEWKTPGGELTGFDIDIGNAVCAKLKMKCVWVAYGSRTRSTA